MLDLLEAYSISEIIIFIIMLGIAIKALISFYDWAIARLRKFFKQETEQEKERDEMQAQIRQISSDVQKISEKQNKISEEINMLIASDKDDIKSYITREHHYFCYQKKYIDDYSLDCIERRYSHYKDEGGNSFIAHLMDEIRALPKQPS